MQDFKYYAPTEVVFGKDAEVHLVEMINKYGGKKVLVNYDSRYASFNNDKSYSIYDTAGGTTKTTLEQGTYTVVTGSFRIDLSSGRKLHWLKTEDSTMTLEEYNANDGSRRARYTLSKI